MYKYNYAVIKYMADARRQEIINVGLIVFREEGVDIRVLESTTKLRIIDGRSQNEDIFKFKKQIENMCGMASSAEEQIEFMSILKGKTYLSSIATFSIDDANQYNPKVLNLFEKLIKPCSFKKAKKHTSRFATSLKNTFKSLDLLAKDASELSEHKVVHNYPINENAGITADFLLKNGSFHLTETIDYNLNDANAKFKETSVKLMTFMEGSNILEGKVNNYFVYNASTEKETEVVQQINLAESYSDRIFNFASRDDKAQYFEIISDAVGHHLPLVH